MHFTFFSLLSITTVLLAQGSCSAMTRDLDMSLDCTNSPQSAIAKYAMTGREYKVKAHEEKKRKKPNKFHARGDAEEMIKRSVQIVDPEASTCNLQQFTSTGYKPRGDEEQDSAPEKIRRSPSTTFQHQPETYVTVREYVLSKLDKIQSLLNEAKAEGQPNDV